MTPMDAWHIISGNMMNYYRMRAGDGFKGYVDADVEAEVIAFKALQEMQKRMDSKGVEIDPVKNSGKGSATDYTQVEDGLPPKPGRYLCIWKGLDYPEGIEDVLNFSGEYFHIEKAFAPGRVKVTHWAQLPERS